MPVNASKLRAARDRLGLENLDIATAMGVSEATVSRWMNGKRTPLVNHLHRLADILQEQVGNLMDDSGPAKTQLLQAIQDGAADLPEESQEALLAVIASMRKR
jgi:transcriptional regulator with XRE-family HTH domain